MRMTDETKPSVAEAAESELFVSVIFIEESKDEKKTMMLSSAVAEQVLESEEDKQSLANCENE